MSEAGADRRGLFPATRASLLEDAQGHDPTLRARSVEVLVRTYWRPVYAHLRLKWRRSAEEAAELTQEFFTRVLEKDSFEKFEPSRGRFRTFLKVCVDRMVLNEIKGDRRDKRGGGVRPLSLDFQSMEAELVGTDAPSEDLVEQVFHREWVRSLLELATEELEARLRHRKGHHAAVFRKLVLDVADEPPPSYATVAAELGISVTDVTNHLFVARREFRACLLDRLRVLCPTDEEFRSEARALLGVTIAA